MFFVTLMKFNSCVDVFNFSSEIPNSSSFHYNSNSNLTSSDAWPIRFKWQHIRSIKPRENYPGAFPFISMLWDFAQGTAEFI